MILIFNNIMQIVFMKKKYTGSMAIFLCLALTACAGRKPAFTDRHVTGGTEE